MYKQQATSLAFTVFSSTVDVHFTSLFKHLWFESTIGKQHLIRRKQKKGIGHQMLFIGESVYVFMRMRQAQVLPLSTFMPAAASCQALSV